MARLRFTQQERMDLMSLAEGTMDDRLMGIARSGSADDKRECECVRQAAAGALETGAARRHGLHGLEGVYERASDVLYGPDSEFDFD
jgi:hypothetical protein